MIRSLPLLESGKIRFEDSMKNKLNSVDGALTQQVTLADFEQRVRENYFHEDSRFFLR